jgi:hypothetical protein
VHSSKHDVKYFRRCNANGRRYCVASISMMVWCMRLIDVKNWVIVRHHYGSFWGAIGGNGRKALIQKAYFRQST